MFNYKKYKLKNTNTTNHFDIGRLRESARDADEEGGQDKKGGQIDRYNRLKEEVPEDEGGDGDGHGHGHGHSHRNLSLYHELKTMLLTSGKNIPHCPNRQGGAMSI